MVVISINNLRRFTPALPRKASFIRPTGRGTIVLDEVDRQLMGLDREQFQRNIIDDLIARAQTRRVKLPKVKMRARKKVVTRR